MSTFDVILWVAMFCTVMLIFCGVCWIMLHKGISKPVVPKPTTFEQVHPNGTHEYRHAYGNWLKCIHCGKMLNRLDLGKKEAQPEKLQSIGYSITKIERPNYSYIRECEFNIGDYNDI